MKSIKRAAPMGAIICTLIIIGLFIHLNAKCAEMEKINEDLMITIEACQETITILETEKKELEEQVAQLTKESTSTPTKNNTNNKNTNTTQPTSSGTSLGQFKISAYCHCSKCCGKSDGITATGVKATANRTIAVDPKVIPLGSTVIIDGKSYVAEDTGGSIKGNRIDMYFSSHQEALNWGVKYKNVSIIR